MKVKKNGNEKAFNVLVILQSLFQTSNKRKTRRNPLKKSRNHSLGLWDDWTIKADAK